MTLSEMLAKLSVVSSWPWQERYNDRWDYISAGLLPEPDFGIVKIVSIDGRFNINIKVLTESEKATKQHYGAIDAEIVNTILPKILAHEVKKADPWER